MVRATFKALTILHYFFMLFNIQTFKLFSFSTQLLADGGQKAELHIVVGGTNTAGFHTDSGDGSGTTPTALVITQCDQGETVQVKAAQEGVSRRGRYNSIWVSVFSGTLLALL